MKLYDAALNVSTYTLHYTPYNNVYYTRNFFDVYSRHPFYKSKESKKYLATDKSMLRHLRIAVTGLDERTLQPHKTVPTIGAPFTIYPKPLPIFAPIDRNILYYEFSAKPYLCHLTVQADDVEVHSSIC